MQLPACQRQRCSSKHRWRRAPSMRGRVDSDVPCERGGARNTSRLCQACRCGGCNVRLALRRIKQPSGGRQHSVHQRLVIHAPHPQAQRSADGAQEHRRRPKRRARVGR